MGVFTELEVAIVSGGIDLTKTVRFGHLRENPRATIVIDDLVSTDPWSPRGVKVRGSASIATRPSARIGAAPQQLAGSLPGQT